MNKLFFLFFFLPILGYSQAGEWWNTDTTGSEGADSKVNIEATTEEFVAEKNDSLIPRQKGAIKIIKDERIEQLIEFKTSVRPPNTEPTMEGFRVQVYFDQERTEIDEARKRLLTLNPDLSTYIEYQAPNYLLLVGNFRSKIDAEKLQNKLLTDFPEGIVVKTEIFLPKVVKE